MLGLYLRLISARLRAHMQYRASFVADLVGQFLITSLDFVALVVLLNRFQSVATWSLPEVAFLYGTSAISLSIAELLVGAFDGFDRLVVRGEFDAFLMRPLGLVFQLLTGEMHLRRLGRLAQGLLALAVALSLLHPVWPPGHWLLVACLLLGGTLFFMAIFIVGATSAFWSPQTEELTNIFTYGGQFMTSYPMNIYQEWLRDIFTFIIPMAFVNYYPTLYLLGKPDPLGLPSWVALLSPAVAVAVFGLSVALWRIGVRHYQSTGS